MRRTMGRGMGALALALVAILIVCPAPAVADEAEAPMAGEAAPEGAVPDGAEAAVPTGVPLDEGAGIDDAPLGTASEAEAVEPLGADVLYSGICGTCSWTIDSDGLLSVFPTNGASGQLDDSWGLGSTTSWQYFPWYQHRSLVRSVFFADGVALPADCTGMFRGCSSLASLDLSGWDTSAVTNMHSMFYGCESLSSLDLSGWDTSKVTSMISMFYGCSSLKSLDLSGWDTSSVTSMRYMFSHCSSLASLDVSGWDTSSVTEMYYVFYDCYVLASLDLSDWDTSSATDMRYMFCGCSSLASLDVSCWDTSSVTGMYCMFYDCSSLVSVDVSGWDTSSVTDMHFMFCGCSSLASLDASCWDTSKVTEMHNMFRGCSSLASLDASCWDTSKVTSMYNMFDGCSSLASLDASCWDTSKVTSMYNMFDGCSRLASLDASGWDTSSVRDMHNMFDGCRSLATVYVGDGWSTARAISSIAMFYDCRSLVGGNGTTYDSSHVDGEYARVDAPGTPGYLTLKTERPIGRFTANLGFMANKVEKSTSVQWDDEWFTNSAKDGYNHQLAIVAAVLSSAAYREPLITKDLELLGFERGEIQTCYDPDYDMSSDHVCFSIANRELENGKPLVVVSIRGTTNDREWLTDFNVDNTNEVGQRYHEGFENAAQEVLSTLGAYCLIHGVDPSEAAFLINGHSLGAAVANLVAAHLNEGYLGTGDISGNVWCYTFATPSVTRDDSEVAHGPGYSNIFSVINPEDFVPMVPFQRWGYVRYGTDLFLPSSSTSKTYEAQYAAMNDVFRGYDGTDYKPYKKGTQVPEDARDYILAVTPSVADAYSTTTSPWYFSYGSPDVMVEKENPPLVNLLSEFFTSGFVSGTAKAVASGNPNHTKAFAKLAAHWNNVAHGHTQETYISWLQSSRDGDGIFPPEVFYRVKLSTARIPDDSSYGSPDDPLGAPSGASAVVRVYDEDSGELLCTVSGDEVEFTDAGAWLAASAEGGVATIDIPDGLRYRIEVEGEGELDLSAERREVAGGALATTCYQDVDLSDGICVADASALDDDYWCRLEQGGQVIEPDVEAAAGAPGVTLSLVAIGNGAAWGNCTIPGGGFVTITAVPEGDLSAFDGWYEAGELVSTETDWSLLVTSDRVLEARFRDLVDISEAAVTVGRQRYTGKAVEPKPTVTLGGAVLAEGTDYELSYEDNVGIGTATVTVRGVGAYGGAASATFEIYEDVQLIPIYRMYNTKTSEHLWTKSKKEYESCGKGSYVDWRQENIAWYSPNLPTPASYAKSTQGDYVYVYRLYDKGRTGDHIYLTYGSEMRQYLSNGWVVDKGAGFWTLKKGATISGRKTIPIYRAYNPKLKRGKHHYTPSKTEYDSICKNHGWKPEGTKFYVVKK